MRSVAGANLLLVFLLGGAACSGGSKAAPGKTCVVNSDCNNPLSCSFGSCHAACAEARDCPAGQMCVKADIGTPVCQLPQESHCQYRSDCKAPLTCALDRVCRSECQADIDCPTKTQKCVLPDKVCAEPADLDTATNRLKNAQATPVPDAPDGGTAGDGGGGTAGGGTGGGGTGGGARDGGGTDDATASCQGPQTSFGIVAQGDSNPHFTSGVGVRSGSQLLIFTAYTGPSVADGGMAASGTDAAVPDTNFVFVQAFALATGKSLGPARPLFQAADGPYFYVHDLSVAPTGEIALLHGSATTADSRQSQLYATFLTVGTGTGPDVQVPRTVKVESVLLGSPHVVWSAAGQAFVASWKYLASSWFLRVKKFLPDGRGAGGDTAAVAVPTGGNNDTSWDEGRVGTSGSLNGVAHRNPNNGLPFLTILDREGNPVGDLVPLSTTTTVGNWIIVGGTTGGFVNLYNNGPNAYGVFVPVGAGGARDAGAPDGGADGGSNAPAYATFSFPTTAKTGQATSDDTGGQGGVGMVLLESNGASFVYVKPDGVTRLTFGTVLSSSTAIQASVSNYRGSFAVSMFETGSHAAQVVATACSP